MKFIALGTIPALFALPVAAQDNAPPREVAIEVEAGRTVGKLPPVWRFFGADEPNYATMKDGRKLLDELGKLRKEAVYFRAHNLLNTGDGTPAFKWGSTDIYREDKDGKPIYNWTVVDRIIDTYRERGIRPYLQLGFMPQALSTASPDTPYQHSWRPGFAYDLIAGGWNTPPKDYGKWAELIYQWTLHNVERYGRAEVEKWYFEIWNEPDGPAYWTGTPEEFNKMHDYAVDAVRRALPTARVGGPDAANGSSVLMDKFLAHVARGTNNVTGQKGTPTDFLAFHAKGSPRFVDGHVRMGIGTHIKRVSESFAKIAAVPELAKKPIVIGESDPEGCAACPGAQNGYRNGTMYSSYTAASFARIWELAVTHQVNLDGVLTWAFTFEDQPYFAGYRQLASNGIDLPVLNVFRMFAQLGENRLATTSNAQVPLEAVIANGVQGEADIGSIATRTADGRIAMLVWHYHDDDVAGPDARVRIRLKGVKGKAAAATVWRVDGDHANAYAAWQKMGSPLSPKADQYAQLQAASAMQSETIAVSHQSGNGMIDLTLKRQGVALLVLDAK